MLQLITRFLGTNTWIVPAILVPKPSISILFGSTLSYVLEVATETYARDCARVCACVRAYVCVLREYTSNVYQQIYVY